MRGPLSGGGGFRASTFAAVYDQLPSADNATSRKAYPRNIPSDAVITVSAGAEYSLDGTTWTSEPGVWGTSRFIMCRGPASDGYDTPVTHTVTFEQIGFPRQFPIMLQPRAMEFVVQTVMHESGVPGPVIGLWLAPDMVDSIGLSTNSYA